MIEKYKNSGKWYDVDGKDDLWASVDFSDPANFAKFGLAEEYYTKSMEYILESLPYDGSWAEKHAWYEGLTFWDRYIYKNLMPKTVGYIEFSANGWGNRVAVAGTIGEPEDKEYISLFGGPNNPDGTFVGSNVVDSIELRGSNLAFGDANTVEFFMKRGVNDFANTTGAECILDVWNNIAYTEADYARFQIYLTAGIDVFGAYNRFVVYLQYGPADFALMLTDVPEIADGLWHFYSITMEHLGAGAIRFNLYVDTELRDTANDNCLASFPIERNLTGWIGAFQAATNALTAALNPGFGKLEACLDEFRFFKTVRTEEQIKEYYRTQVFGGTNSDDENSGLSVYYKFNEGVFGENGADAVVLDYSGRKSNGTWFGYVGGRVEESAFVESGAADSEEEDLILNINHPDVIVAYDDYYNIGRAYDSGNYYNILRTLPKGLFEESNNEDYVAFCQIIGAFFDTMLLLSKNISADVVGKYDTSGLIDTSVYLKYLNSLGIKVSDLFGFSTWNEVLLGKNSENTLISSVEQVKRVILSNIANNAMFMLKSKGTFESLQNALRCFGIAEDVVEVKKYIRGKELDVNNHVSLPKYYRKRFIDFTNEDNHEVVVSNVLGAESGSDYYYIRTIADTSCLEVNYSFLCEVIVPTQPPIDEVTSIFGVLDVNSDDATSVGTDRKVYGVLVKDTTDETLGEIKVSMPYFGFNGNIALSNLREGFWDGGRYVIAAQVYSDELKYVPFGTDSNLFTAKITLFRVTDSQCENIYELSQTGIPKATVDNFTATASRVFLGSHREDISGAVIEKADCKVGEFRFCTKYFTDDEISKIYLEGGKRGIPETYIENAHTKNAEFSSVLLHWGFDSVETIAASYEGLADGSLIVVNDNEITDALAHRYPFSVFGFAGTTVEELCVDEYLSGQVQKDSEDSVLDNNEYSFENYELEKFYKTQRSNRAEYSVEKSLINLVDKEIFNSFSTMNEYFNLFIDASQRYSDEYSAIKFAKEVFFQTIGNNYLDFDKFFNYYKWLDNAVGEFVWQFLPYRSNKKDIGNIVEHHALERSKISYKREEHVHDSRNESEAEVDGVPVVLGSTYENPPQIQFSVYNIENLLNNNFFNNYEVFNTGGRYENNKFWQRNIGYLPVYGAPNQLLPRVFFDSDKSIFTYNYCYDTFLDEAARYHGHSVIVNMFAAPGEVASNSRRCDLESLEKSAYNSVPFRNLASKNYLNSVWMVTV